MRLLLHRPLAALSLALLLGSPAWAQDPPDPAPAPAPAPAPPADPADPPATITPSDRQRPAEIGPASYKLDFVDKPLYEFTQWIADLRRMNFVIGDPKELQAKKVTIISHKEVSAAAVYEAYLAALEVNGYSLSISGSNAKIVKSTEAGQHPIRVGKGGEIPFSDQIVTQLIPLENIGVSDVNSIVTGMTSPGAKVIAYQPANTLIVTDVAHNLRKVYEVLSELDIAAPKSTLEIVPVLYADAEEIRSLIEELYGTAEASPTTARGAAAARRPARRGAEPEPSEGVTTGKEAKYIDKILSDERTNSLIVLANEQGHATVKSLLAELDVDNEGLNESRIYVVRLENAKADEVATVLSELSEAGTNSQSNTRTPANAARPNARAAAAAAATPAADGEPGEGGAIAAFDSGMRIAADENTNALVIIAKPADFEVVRTVIEELDAERRQVFVDATILEISSEDTFELGLAAHLPTQPSSQATGFLGGQFGTNSLGLTQDALSGLAVGVFGPLISVPFSVGGVIQEIDIPAFGVVLNALRTNSSVNIVSNPTLMTLDNEEANIVVGRKVPFPTQTTLSASTGIPFQSFSREDVAITLQVTPRINSSNMVTLEIMVEVQEIEEDDSSLSSSGGGPVTSQRKVETVVLVGDNQTAVLGGLVSNTDTEVETKFPVLGDLPILGAFFRGTRETSRKSNLMIFLTPHIIDDPEDIVEVQRVKEAQRQEFLRRFYGRSRDKQLEELQKMLQYSMNYVDEPSMWRGPSAVPSEFERPVDAPIPPATQDAIRGALDDDPSLPDGSGTTGPQPDRDPLAVPAPLDAPQEP